MRKFVLIVLLSLALTSCQAIDQSEPEVFSGSPEELICQDADMPGSYLLIDDLSGARPNEDLTIDIDNPDASVRYIEATGRLEGWENRFMLIEPTQNLPGFVLCQVVVFTSPEGAQAALDWQDDAEYQVLESDRQIGDEMVLTQASFDAPDGSPWIDHRIEFTYLNLLGAISTYAPEDLANPDYALDLAEVLYERMLDHTP